ncbi:MAG: glycine--tRNA ligase [Candidatus Staskawiczbacteria bacterium RIFOXYB1_FULL_37_44]|uniref:Glycine--tRNA ligase n=1 Tax=Candidatus Staskawiczbacteria bacterium RIFOXYB1_FULL_37_44 TaxID=1802223 RepID=A0A1G2IV76_9BACT|nr:MAG: glycine--tRNA ligase [Candidatus Staskawiczbacteria bacterium RIFOXYB1_FULL_37_44]OGZ83998.1 MAG: glycine--tRNA ligase [Candidatus Staskawiczbacteria bacterium RIFOXYC1_FULL_37_52]OGZ87977.1 MAG: glycine--tRNA ligase [Candidatus Staskawiczbacteria bacterium RIFOXYC2_FULL_37_19]OGZ89568.1 MAG: glycine--tRNA ligase [Candidatus Staskawiczbacteria bacterium RIFOXYD1_FULL_37_110]
MEKIVSLCKRRGFVFPGSEIYGGLANSFDYGPLGVELKNNIKNLWWKRFVHKRDDLIGIDAALIMNPKVWQASGHLETFSDPLAECKKCHHRFRADKIDGKKCPDCGGELTASKQFNLMLKTFLGPVEDAENTVYFRPETAQAMFVDFKNVLDTTRKKIPFGIAQIGKAFRNEITPGNFIFRTREFEQMEIEYFIKEEEWGEVFEMWQEEMWFWMTDVLGLNKKNIHELNVPEKELAHYSKKTIDFEYEFPFGKDELYGLAYRTDFDLKNHYKEPPYEDAETGEKFYPNVIEPTFGVDRSVLAVLCDAYTEEKDRVVLKLKPSLAPYKVAIFPLLKNKPELVAKAREVYNMLRKEFNVAFDDRGNIGKRYYSQDEIGTPFCCTIDFDTLENDTVTLRDRDTTKQERIKILEISTCIKKQL